MASENAFEENMMRMGRRGVRLLALVQRDKRPRHSRISYENFLVSNSDLWFDCVSVGQSVCSYVHFFYWHSPIQVIYVLLLIILLTIIILLLITTNNIIN